MTEDEILAAIDAKDYDVAKREIASWIRKYPKKPLYQALNAYYLVATAPAQEAANACRAIQKQNPNDEHTLDILFDCYKRLSLTDDACSVYQNAAQKSPSIGLLLAWFKKAYSSFDYTMLRDSTAAMSKKSPSSRPYKFYSAFAAYMWSLSRDDAQGVLEVAIQTLEKAQPFESKDEICLYAKILVKVGRLQDVVDLLRHEAPKPLELVLMYLSALKDTENWADLHKVCEKLLFEESFNDYSTWKRYILASYKLGKSYSETASKIELGSRNSYVANVHLHEVYGLDLESSIDTYYAVFQSKPCCALDLSNFKLPESFVSRINDKKVELLSKTEFTSEQLAILQNIEKINSFAGSVIDGSLNSKLESPELSELFLGSMVQNMSSGFTTSDTLKYIIQLEDLAKKDPENFYIKMWLLNLYSLLNVPGLALDTYEDLKIKNVQHDVLAHKLSLNPSPRSLSKLVQIYRFYMTSDENMVKYLESALKKGLYTKLEDLFTFGSRLDKSVSKHLLVINILRISRLLGHDYYHYFLKIAQSMRGDIIDDSFSTVDNRDFETDYKFGFDIPKISLFAQESKKTSKHVQLLYLKELLIAEENPHRIAEFLDKFEQLVKDDPVVNALTPSEQHFFRIYLNVFKVCKAHSESVEQMVESVNKDSDFSLIKDSFLAKTAPLSTSANQILTNVSELIKVIKAMPEPNRLLGVATQLQKGMIGYVITNPELSFFKDMRQSIEIDNLDADFVKTHLDRIEDAARDAKFKLK